MIKQTPRTNYDRTVRAVRVGVPGAATYGLWIDYADEKTELPSYFHLILAPKRVPVEEQSVIDEGLAFCRKASTNGKPAEIDESQLVAELTKLRFEELKDDRI